MKRIEIKSMEIENFKNFAQLNIDFEKHTRLYGKSGCGKSSILNAWLWVCGIDVEEPYPKIDKVVIPDLETVVKCRVSIGNNDYLLARKGKQKWKENEYGEKEFNGYDASNFEIDTIPMNATRYKEKLCECFGIEKYDYIKFLCDMTYFNSNSNSWDWKKRKDILFKIGNIENQIKDIISNEKYSLISEAILKGNKTTEILKQINTEKRAITKNKEDNLSRIKENSEILKQYDIDFDKLKKEYIKLEDEYKNKLSELNNKDSNSIILKLKKDIGEKNNILAMLEIKDNQSKNELLSSQLKLHNELSNIKLNIYKLENGLDELEQDKKSINELKFDRETKCAYCGAEIKKEKIQELKSKFEQEHKTKLSSIDKAIKNDRTEINKLKSEYEKILVQKNNIDDKIYNFKENDLIKTIKNEIAKLQSDIKKAENSKDNNAELKEELNNLEKQIRQINSDLALERLKESANNRIKILQKQQMDLENLEITNEKRRNAIEEYTLETVKVINESINNKFKNISWNLFEKFNSDAERDIKETCEVMYNGKLYSQCSTGEKLITDFYTVLGLQKAFDIELPIFFDEAQSSTFDKKCEQQLIELITNNEDTNISGNRILKR